MKVIILFFVMILAIQVGLYARQRAYKRIAALSEMRKLLLDFGRAIRFYGRPVKFLILDVRQENYTVLKSFVSSLSMYSDKCFADAWSSLIMEFNRKENIFRDVEINLLISFGNNFGYGDLDTQLELISMTQDYFEGFERDCIIETKKNNNLKLMLPIYAGIVFCILVI